MKTNCAKCTEKQKTVTLRTIKRLKKVYPKLWVQLRQQWDPEDKYVKLFESTYADRETDPIPQPSILLIDRFEDSDAEVSPSPPKTTPKTTVKSKPVVLNSVAPTDFQVGNNFQKTTRVVAVTKPTVASITSTLSPSITIGTKTSISPVRTTKSPSVTNKIITTTTKPIITTRFPPIRLPAVPNIGASIQATVSLGTNIVGDIVRGINALGTRVVETGANIAEVVVKSFSRPL